MFVRIVKMGFQKDKIEEFLANFDRIKNKIRNFEGCEHLELLQDKHNTHRFFTYSYWRDEESLENYRNSELFRGVWAETKVLFNEKPEAWSVDQLRIED